MWLCCCRLHHCVSHRPEHCFDDRIHSLQQLVAQLLAGEWWWGEPHIYSLQCSVRCALPEVLLFTAEPLVCFKTTNQMLSAIYFRNLIKKIYSIQYRMCYSPTWWFLQRETGCQFTGLSTALCLGLHRNIILFNSYPTVLSSHSCSVLY